LGLQPAGRRGGSAAGTWPSAAWKGSSAKPTLATEGGAQAGIEPDGLLIRPSNVRRIPIPPPGHETPSQTWCERGF